MNPKTLDTLRYFPVPREVAWQRYLDTIRHADPEEYSSVEEAAWEQLQEMLARAASGSAPAA
jgi:hypothetical protein